MVTTIMMFIMSSVCLLLEVINTMGLVRASSLFRFLIFSYPYVSLRGSSWRREARSKTRPRGIASRVRTTGRLLRLQYFPSRCARIYKPRPSPSFNVPHQFMIGDGVVVWRGAALWGYSWICMAVMLLPLLGDLGKPSRLPTFPRMLIVFTA